MSELLASTLNHMNQIRERSYKGVWGLRILRAVFVSGAVLGLWTYLCPTDRLGQSVLTILAFIVAMAFNSKRHSVPIQQDEFLFSLELDHPETRSPPFSLRAEGAREDVQEEWKPILEQRIHSYKDFERKRLFQLAATLPIPFLLFLLTTQFSAAAFQTALSNVSHVVAQLSQGATLTVLEGLPHDKKKEAIKLSTSRAAEVELLAENLVEIKVVGLPNSIPTVNLKKITSDQKNESVFQSFQLAPVRDQSSQDNGIYSIQFAVTDDVEVYLSHMSDRSPVARVKVRQLPVPKVQMHVEGELPQPWPDDKPLDLNISVKAENPLAMVRLRIKSGQQVYTELVNNIMTDEKKELTTNYSVVLESYVESDQAEVELVAEAIDRSLPQPLIGMSQPLVIQTASAYGRYRQTLQTLHEVKLMLDEMVKTQKRQDLGKAREGMAKALQQAEDSPFFDGLDRVNLGRFGLQISELEQSFTVQELLSIDQALGDFLVEHEIINDRERDRDYFVAVRALSRLVEKDRDRRTAKVPLVTQRIKTFLDERHRRWGIRVKRLSTTPRNWEKIRVQPFHQAMDAVAHLDESGRSDHQQQALVELSKSVTLYREWIEALEAAEDAQKKEQEEKRQQGLANAQNQLRELQKRQGVISSKLDRADAREKEELKNLWPPVRMDQNTNIEAAGQMEAQLRMLSPQAGQRLKASIDAMRLAVEMGGTDDFVQAESAADLAGRLLRQAESAASQSQQQQQRRGRRRRVTGDSYFGSQVAGGDVEIRRDYEVSRRYREDILDDVRNRGGERDAADDQLLENYLRKVVR